MSIGENSIPSVKALAAARGELRRLEVILLECVRNPGTADGLQWDQLETSRRALDDALRTYVLLPTYPGESALWSDVPVEVHNMDVFISTLRNARGADAFSPAVATQLHIVFERIDDVIRRVLEFNAEFGLRHAREIERTRREGAMTSLLLNTASALLALVTATLIVAFVRRSQREIARHQQLAETRAEELDAFAGRVAHDIKGPLSGALLWIEMTMRKGSADEAMTSALQRLSSSLGRVIELTDALLGFARAAAQPDLSARASVADAFRDVREDVHGAATAAEITLDVEDVASSLHVACPRGVLASILANLARNAIKYMGDRQTRRVALRAHSKPDRVRIEVVDTGPGMSRELASTCFEPFRRAPDASQPGLGLGLATVRRLVHGYAGDVGVISKEGEGSTFWVELPSAN